MHILDLLEKRGLIEQTTSPDLRQVLDKPSKFYVGFDPTSDALHVGSLVPIIVLKWLQKYGHKPYVIIGGATGRIGDPSGKSEERPLLHDEDIQRNIKKISDFFYHLFEKDPPIILDNDKWYREMNIVDFLRDVGKHFRMGSMLSKESVKMRIKSEEGMSFTEFTYQALQAYDFYHLHKQHGVSLQIGGSDQWGNITAGIDLNKKLDQAQVYGMTFPLLMQSNGKKFGKTEKGAIWLSEHKLSPYDFYQHIYRVSDADVIRLMKMLTFIDLEEIEEIEKSMKHSSYIPNSAQKRLADELTLIIHKKQGLHTAITVTNEVYSKGNLSNLSKDALEKVAKDMPHIKLKKQEILGKKYVELAFEIGLCSSKSEAVRLIKNGGAYLNNERISNIDLRIFENAFIDDLYLLFGIGKRKKILIEIND